ncbi:hypothetical protein MF672_051065 (plasmid) [Actinomadura sp. ATCC 31491]|uniref:Uncharacterized protein n=1 Tax=Actinomadura luzonensis TaxID=2805427 RepID=A0ABT0GBW4_9ACTN|nr:hypothetical protein [Actinomadura luzonensis]MCK2222095.1 hypothetical protein [Actinomadura luzonensis]
MTTRADARAQLAKQVERLEAAYETACERLVEDTILRRRPRTAPEEERDSGGRFVLLDALTALVNARAVLAQQPQESGDGGR